MIERENLVSLFEELDTFLSQHKEKRHLIIYGGAALIALNILERVTYDVDVFQPQLDSLLREGISLIGERHQLGALWMNSTGRAFVEELPKNWMSRLQTIYQGKFLTISSLGREDLIFTKMLAELDRQEDLEDIKSLRPTSKELKFVQQKLLEVESSKDWQKKVRSLINNLGGKS